jgi:hypothetical protein
MFNVYCPLVAVLRDHARHHLVKRVATLVASGFKVSAMARFQGSGLHVTAKTPDMNDGFPPEEVSE